MSSSSYSFDVQVRVADAHAREDGEHAALRVDRLPQGARDGIDWLFGLLGSIISCQFFPGGLEDCERVLEYVMQQCPSLYGIDPSKVCSVLVSESL